MFHAIGGGVALFPNERTKVRVAHVVRDLVPQIGRLPGSVLWTMALIFDPWRDHQTALNSSNSSPSMRCAMARVAVDRGAVRVGRVERDPESCTGRASASSRACRCM